MIPSGCIDRKSKPLAASPTPRVMQSSCGFTSENTHTLSL